MLTMISSLTSNPAKSTQKRHIVGLTGVALEDDFNQSDLQVVHANGKLYQVKFKEFLFQFIGELSTELEIEVDWSLSLEDAIKAGGYDSQFIDTGAKLPPSGLSGRSPVKVGLNKRDRVTTNQEWIDYLKGLGEPWIHPLVLLKIGAKFQNKQRKAPMFTVWFEGGQLWYLMLNENFGFRHVHVFRLSLVNSWFDDCLGASARK